MFKEKFLIFFLSIKFLIVIADLPSETNYQYITELEVTKTEDNYLLYEPKTSKTTAKLIAHIFC